MGRKVRDPSVFETKSCRIYGDETKTTCCGGQHQSPPHKFGKVVSDCSERATGDQKGENIS